MLCRLLYRCRAPIGGVKVQEVQVQVQVQVQVHEVMRCLLEAKGRGAEVQRCR